LAANLLDCSSPRTHSSAPAAPETNRAMSIYIDSNDRFIQDNQAGFALDCPHCDVFSHMTAISVPRFEPLAAHKPAFVGLVYRCDSCNAPVFLKAPAKVYGANRIELGSNFMELERAREKFNYTYLPEETETLFREALASYGNGCFNAFASMCRRTAQSVFHEQGESGRLRVFDQLAEIRTMVELDGESYALLKKVIFGTDEEPYPSMPELGAETAGMVLEVMKDLLYESYVRKGNLQQAMMVRRFFV
jgi:hypothetical protein